MANPVEDAATAAGETIVGIPNRPALAAMALFRTLCVSKKNPIFK